MKNKQLVFQALLLGSALIARPLTADSSSSADGGGPCGPKQIKKTITIDQSGPYCVSKDFTGKITINADDVLIDLLVAPRANVEGQLVTDFQNQLLAELHDGSLTNQNFKLDFIVVLGDSQGTCGRNFGFTKVKTKLTKPPIDLDLTIKVDLGWAEDDGGVGAHSQCLATDEQTSDAISIRT